MRENLVHVFVPQEHIIEAKDYEDALEKVGELYKELYKKDFMTWIEPLREPDDDESWLTPKVYTGKSMDEEED